MMNRLLLTLFFLFTCLAAGEAPEKNVAIVKVLRGKAIAVSKQGSQALKRGMWLREGSVVKTEARSFVRLGFIDKSTMNVGPKSEMKIEKFSGNEASVINVLSGKIRAEVSKNYLNIDKNKSKMFVKSKAAVMGIRGTDFIFSANEKTGAATAVLFEGSVVFNKLNPNDNLNDLESIVDKGRRINPGQFSVARSDLSKPTVPAKMSSSQFRALEKNKNFDEGISVAESSKGKKRSFVPPGLSGEVVSPDEKGVQESLKGIVDVNLDRQPGSEKPADTSKGFVEGQDIKPGDGSIVHIDSGTIIPLGADSKYDQNTQEWVSGTFEVDSSGQPVPPEGYELTEDGSLVKIGTDQEVNFEVKPLDESKPLDQMIQEEAPVLEGPEPSSVNLQPDGLERPPIQPGDTVQRDNFNGDPSGSGDGSLLPPPPPPPKTPVHIIIQNDGSCPAGANCAP